MTEFLYYIFNNYQIFILVFIRTSGIFLVSPLFSSENIPNMVKVGFSILLTYVISLSLPLTFESEGIHWLALLIRELLVGSIIGFIGYIFFTAFYVMGQMIDMNIGFGMVNVVDPQSRIQVPLMGNFYYILAFLLLLMVDGHHLIIKALIDSYEYIPIGTFIYSDKVFYIILNSMIKTFEIGLKLSLPIVAIIFLTDIILGVLARTIPQMNVFVVGMPLKLLIGLLVLLIGFNIFFNGLEGIFELIVDYIYKFLEVG